MNQAEQINKAIEELSRRENAYCSAVVAHAQADSDYRIAKAEALLKAEGTDKMKEATAIVECKELLRGRDNALATMNFTKEKLIDVRAVLSSRQSILSAETRNFQLSEKYSA